MNVLVDTSVWSLSLRRAKRVDDTASRELAELIREGRVVMMGPIRQELLSGIKVKSQFELLRDHLRAFSDITLELADDGQEWLAEHAMDLAGSWFYSDSHNDLPLLERVDNPVAVDPDEALRRHAERHGWPVISLRQRSRG